MGYVEVKGFLSDTFRANGRDIMQEAMSRCRITDIDTASKEEKKEFADYILKYHLNFSPQKNRYLYDQLMKSLGIGTLFDLKNFRHIVEDVKKGESLVLSSLASYWTKIKHAFGKYEVILNLYWLKGVDAEAHGTDKGYVLGVMKKSLAGIAKDSEDAYNELVEEVDLAPYLKKKKFSVFKLRLFDDEAYQEKSPDIDPDTKMMLDNVLQLKKTVDEALQATEEILASSLDRALEIRLKGEDETAYAEDVKSKVVKEWEYLKSQYEIIRKRFEVNS